MALELINGKLVETVVTDNINEKITRERSYDPQDALTVISASISDKQKQIKSLQDALAADLVTQTKIITALGA